MKVQDEAAFRIRAELVCCDIYARINDTCEITFEQARVDNGSTHTICYWGEAAARIAEKAMPGSVNPSSR